MVVILAVMMVVIVIVVVVVVVIVVVVDVGMHCLHKEAVSLWRLSYTVASSCIDKSVSQSGTLYINGPPPTYIVGLYST